MATTAPLDTTSVRIEITTPNAARAIQSQRRTRMPRRSSRSGARRLARPGTTAS